MVETSLMASTVLMGLLLVVTAAVIASGRNWRAYTPERRVETPTAGRLVESESVWVAVFFVLVFVAGTAAVLFVGGVGASESLQRLAGIGALAVLGVALAGYLLWGVYSASRHRGFHRAAAVGMVAFVVGLLFLLLVVLTLFEVV